MRGSEEIKVKRTHIIDLCYHCYVERGIENISVRDFCRACNLNPNTLYYYFRDKDEILFECVKYGYMKLENSMFDVVDNSPLEDMHSNLIEVWNSFSPELRFLYQAVSSPSYNGKRTHQFLRLNSFYDRFGERLAQRLGCPYAVIRASVHDILTFMSYYSLWGSEDVLADSCIDRFNNLLNMAAEHKKDLS